VNCKGSPEAQVSLKLPTNRRGSFSNFTYLETLVLEFVRNGM